MANNIQIDNKVYPERGVEFAKKYRIENGRVNFSRAVSVIEPPDLLAIQKESYEKALMNARGQVPSIHEVGRPVYMNSKEAAPSPRPAPKGPVSATPRPASGGALNAEEAVSSDSIPAGTVQIFPIGMK